MRDPKESASPVKNIILWVVTLGIIAGGVGSNFYYSHTIALPIRIAGLIIMACVALLIAAQTTKGRIAVSFAKEARIELRRVVWPNRQETVQTTLVVVVIVLLTGLMLWGVDSILLWAVGLLQAG